MYRQDVYNYIRKKYKVEPDYPWRGQYEECAVFRHKESRKWFALSMELMGDKVGLEPSDKVNVINLKVDDLFFRDMIIEEAGIMPAYHMNKQHWITVLLDGTVTKDRIYDLIDMSFSATDQKKK